MPIRLLVAILLGVFLAVLTQAQPRLYPSAARPPKRLLVLNMQGSSDYEERCLVASAQGLFNSRPGTSELVYVVWTAEDVFWLKWLKPSYVPSTQELKSVGDLLALLPKNAVLYNEHPSQLPDIATTYAGCSRLLLAGSPEIVKRYGLNVKADLSDRFQTNAEAYQWVWDRCKEKISRRVASFTVPYRTPTHNPAQLRDYLIANEVFTFWVSGDLDQKTIGADRKAEEATVESILRKFPVNTPVLGYPWSGDGYGAGESDGVSLLSRVGKFLIPTDNFTNLSVWTAFEPSKKKFPEGPPPPAFDKGETYAALVMSDGDNLCTYQNYWPAFWEGLKDRSVPIGWTMGPTLSELAPPIFDYAVAHLPYGHTVGSGVSGVGYMAIDQFGKDLPNGGEALDSFVKLTERKCTGVGERWLWLMRYGAPYSPDLLRYVSGLKSISTVMGGYGKVTSNAAASVEREGAVTIFHGLLSGGNADEIMPNLDGLLKHEDHPRFLQIFLMNWGYKPEDVQRLANYCKSIGIHLVTPEQLSALSRKASGS